MTKKILVVDDEVDFCDSLKQSLEAGGYRVITVYDGYQGLQNARSEKPDLILLDVLMPHMDGFDVLMRLKRNERTKRIPVIMLTAKSDTAAIFKSQELSATDYLIKPFQFEELLNLMKSYLF